MEYSVGTEYGAPKHLSTRDLGDVARRQEGYPYKVKVPASVAYYIIKLCTTGKMFNIHLARREYGVQVVIMLHEYLVSESRNRKKTISLLPSTPNDNGRGQAGRQAGRAYEQSDLCSSW